jgi:hypothetical protein
MSWRMSSSDSSLNYFQDWNLCAIGLWVVYEGVAMPGPSCGRCPQTSTFENHAAWLEAYTYGSKCVVVCGNTSEWYVQIDVVHGQRYCYRKW